MIRVQGARALCWCCGCDQYEYLFFYSGVKTGPQLILLLLSKLIFIIFLAVSHSYLAFLNGLHLFIIIWFLISELLTGSGFHCLLEISLMPIAIPLHRESIQQMVLTACCLLKHIWRRDTEGTWNYYTDFLVTWLADGLKTIAAFTQRKYCVKCCCYHWCFKSLISLQVTTPSTSTTCRGSSILKCTLPEFAQFMLWVSDAPSVSLSSFLPTCFAPSIFHSISHFVGLTLHIRWPCAQGFS